MHQLENPSWKKVKCGAQLANDMPPHAFSKPPDRRDLHGISVPCRERKSNHVDRGDERCAFSVDFIKNLIDRDGF